jgi:hypothetical protein
MKANATFMEADAEAVMEAKWAPHMAVEAHTAEVTVVPP